MATLATILDEHTRHGELWTPLDEKQLRCLACGHRCRIAEGRRGVCQVRFNRDGKLFVPWGYAAGLHSDPIEKKPFFHVLPGSTALSFGLLGCNLHCPFCQNWVSSQALRDPAAGSSICAVEAEQIVRLAVDSGAASVISTYNEPLITAEWAVEVFRAARRAGLLTGFVSNGYATPEVLEYLRPHMDLFKVDLKCFDDAHYGKLGGRLEPVLDSIRRIHALGFWLEVVTLVVPGFNDSEDELARIAGFLAGISPDIPWHVTAFHADYRMLDPPATPVATLARAAAIGRREGLRFVYAGNLPARMDHLEDTLCPGCGAGLVVRAGYRILRNRLSHGGCCPECGAAIAGRWVAAPAG